MFRLTDPLFDLNKSTNVRFYDGLFTGAKVATMALKTAIKLWRHRSKTRRELATFDARSLADAGISQTMADFEVALPFWQPHTTLGIDALPEQETVERKPPVESVATPMAGFSALHTKDGTALLIRPLNASDRGHVLDLFETSSDESRYRRFLSHVRSLSEQQLDRLSQPDGHNHLAWLAFEPDGDALRCVGVARIARTAEGSDDWEFSVSVRDSDHGRGIGSVLLSQMAVEADKRGIHSLCGHVLKSNRPMVEYARHREAKFTLDYPGVYRFKLETRAMIDARALAA